MSSLQRTPYQAIVHRRYTCGTQMVTTWVFACHHLNNNRSDTVLDIQALVRHRTDLGEKGSLWKRCMGLAEDHNILQVVVFTIPESNDRGRIFIQL